MVAVSAAAPAARAQDFTPEQKKAIESIVHGYIVAHPEVLQEAMAELEKRQQTAQETRQQQALATEKETLLKSKSAVVVGNPDGDVTLVEFFDYNCGFCKRAVSDMSRLLKDDAKLRVVMRDFPVLGQESLEASRIALAAKQQLTGERAFDYHRRLMAVKGRVGKEQAEAVAREMGLDMKRLAKDADSPAVVEALKESRELGDKLGLTGTPSFIIGDTIIPGAVGHDAMAEAIKSVRQCGKASCG
ncbi:DsbA family protein [Camelimonas lactis]|uniref:Protein-disulfide isomerase n=1 Tax=Camelimonas lactis TaxID=659006 RepID=A0A4R2GNS4_9HYPH|nr:DsbA family protein [Camelimonas lactis]TCO10349.1 protein-disulfide isomerase [Camelimonas lactis]